MLEAIQRGIERALLNLQAVLRDLLNAEQDAVAVQRPQRDGLEDEEVEGALQQLGRVAHAALLDVPGERCTTSPRASRREPGPSVAALTSPSGSLYVARRGRAITAFEAATAARVLVQIARLSSRMAIRRCRVRALAFWPAATAASAATQAARPSSRTPATAGGRERR